MPLSTAEKIRVLLKRRNMSISKLAELTGQSRQNLTQKLERDNLNEKELHQIAEAMGCVFESYFVFDDGEKL